MAKVPKGTSVRRKNVSFEKSGQLGGPPDREEGVLRRSEHNYALASTPTLADAVKSAPCPPVFTLVSGVLDRTAELFGKFGQYRTRRRANR
ncbi:hypothetical protein SAMN05216368_11236 [Cryobacterium flavum]|uniref:Uncharacterized protein n=1 Tax=Cryobacterium flavum TaxID=1424659 RepID=A0A5E9G1U5_9MICO|nr:hypothetical protein SAMN05216368_11236 [Cryobacterium flavum]